MFKKNVKKGKKTINYVLSESTTPTKNSNSDDCDTEYEVEGILDKRCQNGQTQYKVKWKNYSISESTWEPKENLKRAKDAVNKFEKNFLQHKKKRPTKVNKNEQKQKYFTITHMENKIESIPIEENSSNFESAMTDNESTSKSDNGINNESRKVEMEIEKINDIFILESELIARVSCKIREGTNKVCSKTKIMTTQELGKIAPQKLLQYYEKKIKFNKE